MRNDGRNKDVDKLYEQLYDMPYEVVVQALNTLGYVVFSDYDAPSKVLEDAGMQQWLRVNKMLVLPQNATLHDLIRDAS